MKKTTFTLTDAEVAGALAAYFAAQIPPEKMEQMMHAAIEQRIGTITLDEAQKKLGLPSRRELFRSLGRLNVPIVHESAKRKYIRVAALESAMKAREVCGGQKVAAVVRVGSAKVSEPDSAK